MTTYNDRSAESVSTFRREVLDRFGVSTYDSGWRHPKWRCEETALRRSAIRQCDLVTAHDGPHESNDDQGRAEYYWWSTR